MPTRFVRSFAIGSIAFLLAHAVPCQPARAEEAPAAIVIETPVTVTATRLPTPENEVGSSVTVITAPEIEAKQERTLPDVLKDVPGLNVVQTGGPGGQTSVFIRGTNSNHVKVFIDGVDVSDPSNPNNAFDFAHVLTGTIERVEVLRGPQSGLYGSDAIGGVINVITKAGSGPPQFIARTEGGSFGTFNQTGLASGSLERFSYSLDVQHFHSAETPVTPLYLLPPGRKRIDDAYDNVTVGAKLGAQLTETADIGLVARYIGTSLDFTGTDFNVFRVSPLPPRATARRGRSLPAAPITRHCLGAFSTTRSGSASPTTATATSLRLPCRISTGVTASSSTRRATGVSCPGRH